VSERGVSLRLELFTDSLSASLDFYGRVLGFEKEAEHGGYTPLARGSARIALNLLSDLSESHGIDQSHPKLCGEISQRLPAEMGPAVARVGRRCVKFCGTCSREVFLCDSDAEAVAHARAGHCIAKPVPDLSGLPPARIILGKPEVPAPEPRLEERLLIEQHSHEVGKINALRDVEYASRTCPRCGYPCADWLRVCGVCRHQIGARPAGRSEV
jgi:hypothetical protein